MSETSSFNRKLRKLTERIKAKTQQLEAAVMSQQPIPKDETERKFTMAVQPIDDLVASVTKCETVIDSAITLIDGFSKRLSDGIAAALQGGATAAQLAPLTNLKADVDAKTAALSTAVQANTPPAADQIPPVETV